MKIDKRTVATIVASALGVGATLIAFAITHYHLRAAEAVARRRTGEIIDRLDDIERRLPQSKPS